mgnify:CR=1 FL=1
MHYAIWGKIKSEQFISYSSSKELLLKCGFSELDDVYENDNIEVTNIDGKFRLTYNVYEYIIAEKPIEYLHQIQNLFLDLTDRVLDVKL